MSKKNHLELLVDKKTIHPGETINCIVNLRIQEHNKEAKLLLKFKGFEETKTVFIDDVSPTNRSIVISSLKN